MTIEHTLRGLVAGDVLGSGYEGGPPVGPVAGPAPGAGFTDDSQQTLVVAYHLLRHGAIEPAALAAEFLALDTGRYRGIGPGFAAFLAHLRDGATYDEAAQVSAGNGAAMRVAPIAVWHHGLRDDRIGAAIDASLVTHADPRGIAAAVAVAEAIAESSRGAGGADLLHAAAIAAEDAEHELFSDRHTLLAPSEVWHVMSGALFAAVDLVSRPLGEAAGLVGSRVAVTARSGRSGGTEAYAPASVTTALLAAATRPPERPWDAVGSVVGLGGDADTMGAIAGAVIGAATDRPPPWEVPLEDLTLELGRRLAAQRAGVEGLPELGPALG